MKLSNQKGFAPVFLLLGFAILVLIGIGGMYFYNQTKTTKDSNYQNISETSVDPVSNTPIESEKDFLEAFKAKYPRPEKISVPTGLDDELLQAYKNSKEDRQDLQKSQFRIDEYYGDVAEVGIASCIPPETCGGSSATMNKNNNMWEVMFEGQEAPRCDDIPPVLSKLRDWQGLCFTDDPKTGSRLIDGKHPEESYNSY